MNLELLLKCYKWFMFFGVGLLIVSVILEIFLSILIYKNTNNISLVNDILVFGRKAKVNKLSVTQLKLLNFNNVIRKIGLSILLFEAVRQLAVLILF